MIARSKLCVVPVPTPYCRYNIPDDHNKRNRRKKHPGEISEIRNGLQVDLETDHVHLSCTVAHSSMYSATTSPRSQGGSNRGSWELVMIIFPPYLGC